MSAVPEQKDKERWQEFLACLALRHTPGIGAITWKKLLDHFGSARAAIQNRRQWSEAGLASEGQAASQEDREAVQREADLVWARKDRFVLYTDPDYPERLRAIPGPPVLLYFSGRRELLQSPAVAVVGSRGCSSYGLRQAEKICQELSASGICIVSGLACGIDRQAHLSGLGGTGKSIAVLGTGLDIIYPALNRDIAERLFQEGLIVSEFAPGTKPEGHNFPVRNRIVSGLCLGVVVVQAAIKSGSMVTARLALEQGREVFAVPGPVDQKKFEGCHYLIRQGGVLTQSAQDILVELAPQLRAFLAPDTKENSGRNWNHDFVGLSAKEVLVVKCLQDGESRHIDSLQRELGWAGHELPAVLLDLELAGRIRCLPGMRYVLLSTF